MIFRFIKIFSILLSIYIIIIFSACALISCYMKKIGEEISLVKDQEILVEIPYGSSLKKLSHILYQSGLIDSERRFYWYLRLGRKDGLKVQAGFYQFLAPITKSSLAQRLLHGYDQSFKVVFKEGEVLQDLAHKLDALEISTKEHFIEAMISEEVLTLINAPYAHERSLLNEPGGIEGYLFPDTYFFSKNYDPKTIIKKMYERLLKAFDDTMWAHMKAKHISLHEVLTLASIIEKETANSEEKAIVSSVYHNRLRLNMRLQADPTVIYGLRNFSGKLSRKDLREFHDYNTYMIYGLPKGPISSVSLASIKAALWPKESDYLYFVSRNDGSHEFCATLSCHNQAVQKWQINYFHQKN